MSPVTQSAQRRDHRKSVNGTVDAIPATVGNATGSGRREDLQRFPASGRKSGKGKPNVNRSSTVEERLEPAQSRRSTPSPFSDPSSLRLTPGDQEAVLLSLRRIEKGFSAFKEDCFEEIARLNDAQQRLCGNVEMLIWDRGSARERTREDGSVRGAMRRESSEAEASEGAEEQGGEPGQRRHSRVLARPPEGTRYYKFQEVFNGTVREYNKNVSSKNAISELSTVMEREARVSAAHLFHR